MSIRLNSSSRPGMTDSSSASTVSTPPQLSRLMTYSWISRQLASSRAWVSICSAHRRSLTWRGSAPSSASKESASEWAGSVDITSVRWPRSAALAAVAAATVVLPTPPLPVNNRIRTRAPRVWCRAQRRQPTAGPQQPRGAASGSAGLHPLLQVGQGRPDDLLGRLALEQARDGRGEADLQPVGDAGELVVDRVEGVRPGQVVERAL